MKERLVIKNFGPIKSVDLELGKMTVLIGDQATGKSTIAKVLAVCRYFSYLFPDKGVFQSYFQQGLASWGVNYTVSENTLIQYECDEYSLSAQLRKTDSKIGIFTDQGEIEDDNYWSFQAKITPKSNEFEKLYNEFSSIIDESQGFINFSSSVYSRVKPIMNNPFYFPTERGLQSIFSLGKNSINNVSDALFNQFALLDQIARNFTNETSITPLGIIYKNVNGQGFIKKKNSDEFHSLYHGASGYQSTIPVILTIQKYNELDKRSKAFLVEEPELNLFPKTQKQLIEFFVRSINKYDNQFLLTTHSPYVLSALNTLMYAYKIGNLNRSDRQKTNEIINEEYWMNSNEVRAYYLNENGESQSIIDQDDELINTDFIDSVSEIITAEFDQLLKIEIEYNNEQND